MSLESEVANLVSETRSLLNYFNAKKAGIESAVSAAIAAVPETTRSWFVDQIAGLDTNPGTSAAPFKTIEKAVVSTPNSGVCGVYLLKDYDLLSQIDITCSLLVIRGGSGAEKLRPKYYTQANGGVSESRLGGFAFQRQGANIELRELTLVLPSPAGVNPAVVGNRPNSFLRTFGSYSVPPVMGVQMNALVVQKADDFAGYLISASASCVALGCGSVSFPTDFAGRYIDGIAAGTDTKTISRVLTNLATL
ncbi:hypothetical protein PspS04_12050 [Pseudomonas sp. S04]|uniref:hypothetical protein n=1 Tax=unclassified Pseudomonas TaxID=196821 RepID=UPI00131FAEB9|nr:MULTISPECIES: hypothetical protein [unclassified Pseudomonas]QHD01041.1 hypothetical protein PspS04_12050 [Pseudomonas sp. S04]QHF33525.1 hypothetical protein PspS19_12055 [Pseudomonas sp. S19]